MEFQYQASSDKPTPLRVFDSAFQAGNDSNIGINGIEGGEMEMHRNLISKMRQELMIEMNMAMVRFESKIPILLRSFLSEEQQTLLSLQLSEPEPLIEKKDKLIRLPRHGQNNAAKKRKKPQQPDIPAPLPPTSSKKPKEEWICAKCQFTATSEEDFFKHLQGKDHNATEEKEEPSEEEEKKSEIDENETELKKEDWKFRCEMCSVIAYCKITMDAHLNGKKHKAKVKKLSGESLSMTPVNVSPSPLAVVYPSEEVVSSGIAEFEGVKGEEEEERSMEEGEIV